MSPDEQYKLLIDEVRELLPRLADARGNVQVSDEVLARLMGIAASSPVEVGATDPATEPEDLAVSAPSLEALDALVRACTRCGLDKTRRQTVFGVGNPHAELVFVGEAPGEDEDRQGEPFVGRAGQLLTDIIVKGMKMRREDVYICNVLKCHPPANRDPNPHEVRCCEPYLIRQLELIRPKVIVALGRHAAQTLLRTDDSTGKLRGRWHDYHGIPLRVTYHPAYLLRTPSEKRKTWEDIQEVMKFLAGESGPSA